MSGWIGARVAGGLGIVVGLLAAVLVAWWARGVAEATALFQLLQGVILATLGWLYGSQGLERAEAAAISEAAARAQLRAGAAQVAREASGLEEEDRAAAAILSELMRDPALGRKINDAMREVRGERK